MNRITMSPFVLQFPFSNDVVLSFVEVRLDDNNISDDNKPFDVIYNV